MSKVTKAFLLLVLTFLFSTMSGPGQTVYTVLTNGPITQRYNIVFLSEGYTNSGASQALFRSDCTNASDYLFSREPYKEYKPYCNVFCIFVASTNAGSDHPLWGITNKTYFDSSYDPYSDYYIAIPSAGQTKVESFVAPWDCDMAILLVNDSTPGGSDGGGKTAIAAVGNTLPRGYSNILVHETGHVVAGLGDEYSDANPGYPNIEEPNTTTNLANLKWAAWVSPGVPIPTPNTLDYIDSIGAFEGAHYHPTGWYRPKFYCTMQNEATLDFCEVCREALVLNLCKPVKRVISFSPATAAQTITNVTQLSYSLTLLDPATHALRVDWSINGTLVLSGTNRALSVSSANLPYGTSTVQALVYDATPFVRNDSAKILYSTNAWVVTNPAPPLLVSPQYLTGSNFAFTVQNVPAQGVYVERSTNLTSWVRISTNTAAGGQFRFTNSTVGYPRTFFRVRNAP